MNRVFLVGSASKENMVLAAGTRISLRGLICSSSTEDMRRHIRSDLYLWILNAIELSSKTPEICFHEDTETTGIELIEAIRVESTVK